MTTLDARVTRRALRLAIGMTGAMYALLWIANSTGGIHAQ
jgi:hypothetical protein